MLRFAVLTVTLAACASTPHRLLAPQDWTSAQDLEVLSIEGRGFWERLWSKPVFIGEYELTALDKSFWDTTPDQSSVSIGIGNVGIGSQIQHNESEYSFRISAQGADLAAIRCEQYLHIEDWAIGGGDQNSSVSIHGNNAFLATLSCRAQGFHPDWPTWELDVRAVDERPYFGILRVAEQSWVVAAQQDTNFGKLSNTGGYRLSLDAQSRALLDFVQQPQLSLLPALSVPERLSAVAATAALMLANDPVESR